MIDVLGVQDVVTAIEGLLDSPEKYLAIGRGGQAWSREHVADKAVAEIEDAIVRLARGR